MAHASFFDIAMKLSRGPLTSLGGWFDVASFGGGGASHDAKPAGDPLQSDSHSVLAVTNHLQALVEWQYLHETPSSDCLVHRSQLSVAVHCASTPRVSASASSSTVSLSTIAEVS